MQPAQVKPGAFLTKGKSPEVSAKLLSILFLCFSLLSSQAAGASLAESFKGSALSVNNAVSSLSFQKDGQLTYNPYYAITVQAAPRYAFNDHVYASPEDRAESYGHPTDITEFIRKSV